MESDQTAMLISSYYNTFRETDIVRFVLKIYNKSKLTDKLGYLVCDVDSKALRTIMEKYSLNDEVFYVAAAYGGQAYCINRQFG